MYYIMIDIENSNNNDNEYIEIYLNFLDQPTNFDEENDITMNRNFIGHFMYKLIDEERNGGTNIDYNALDEFLRIERNEYAVNMENLDFELTIALYHITQSMQQIYNEETKRINTTNIADFENFTVSLFYNIKIIQEQSPELFEPLNNFILSILDPRENMYVLKGGNVKRRKRKTNSKRKINKKNKKSHKKQYKKRKISRKKKN